MKSKILAAVIITVLIFTNELMISSAYNLSGYRWESKTIYYYMKTKSGKAIPVYKKAAQDWTKKTNIKLKKTTNKSKKDVITCTTTSKKNVEWDGLCKWTRRGDTLIRATIYLNRAKVSYKNKSSRQSVATHEFGHALGLEHQNGKYLMNPYTYGSTGRWSKYKLKSPISNEVKGINKLYKK